MKDFGLSGLWRGKLTTLLAVLLIAVCLTMVWSGKATLTEVSIGAPALLALLFYKGGNGGNSSVAAIMALAGLAALVGCQPSKQASSVVIRSDTVYKTVQREVTIAGAVRHDTVTIRCPDDQVPIVNGQKLSASRTIKQEKKPNEARIAIEAHVSSPVGGGL